MHIYMEALSWLDVETLERVSTPLVDKLARYCAYGHSFTRLWYMYLSTLCRDLAK